MKTETNAENDDNGTSLGRNQQPPVCFPLSKLCIVIGSPFLIHILFIYPERRLDRTCRVEDPLAAIDRKRGSSRLATAGITITLAA